MNIMLGLTMESHTMCFGAPDMGSPTTEDDEE